MPSRDAAVLLLANLAGFLLGLVLRNYLHNRKAG